MLMNEELLDYEGAHRTRALCHLLTFGCGTEPLVCVVGNFDGDLGSLTTNAVEVVATAVAARVTRDVFRLIDWYPHDGERRFSEVTLIRIAARPIAHGEMVISDDEDAQMVRRDSGRGAPRPATGSLDGHLSTLEAAASALISDRSVGWREQVGGRKAVARRSR
jgi:hypothetical protein